MCEIYQRDDVKLIFTTKTVDWLVENTTVKVFDPLTFTGYQRKINDNHCRNLVDYLCKDFFLPTAIICATSENYTSTSPLRIVDGQHRVHAFRMLKEENLRRYEEIKNKEIPIIVMEKVDEKLEIDTFITINKTSRKVDTSLAIVLKNKINKYASSDDLSMPKAEYLSVEVALKLNECGGELWGDKILLEGTTRNTNQLITLNAFVKSTRTLIKTMEKAYLMVLDWNNESDINSCIDKCLDLINTIWFAASKKWNDLFSGDLDIRRIIQGPIGYSSLNKVVINWMNSNKYKDLTELKTLIQDNFNCFSIESNAWRPGGYFAGFSSEAGYSIIANELIRSIKN